MRSFFLSLSDEPLDLLADVRLFDRRTVFSSKYKVWGNATDGTCQRSLYIYPFIYEPLLNIEHKR